jgi:hypothetical protein
VLIPYEDYLRFQQMQEYEVLTRFDQVRDRLDKLNATYSDEEIAADIEAALAGGTGCIVSSDAYLVDMGSFEDIPILRPSEFIAQR